MYTRGETSIGRRTVESIKTKSHVPRKHVRRSRGVRFRFDRGSATTFSFHDKRTLDRANRIDHATRDDQDSLYTLDCFPDRSCSGIHSPSFREGESEIPGDGWRKFFFDRE